MANNNAPFGILPRGINKGFTTPSFSLAFDRKFANALSTKAYRGDGLRNVAGATGYIAPVTAAAVPVSQWVGIFWGCAYLSVSQGKRITVPYWPGADATGDIDVQYIPLIGAPPGVFVAQSSGASAVGFADIGKTCDIAYTTGTQIGAFSKSGVTIAQSTLSTGATQPFRLEGLYSSVVPAGTLGTDDTSPNNWVLVSFNSMQSTGIS